MEVPKIRPQASFSHILDNVTAEKDDCMISEGCVFFPDEGIIHSICGMPCWHDALEGRQYTYFLRAAADWRAATCFQTAVHFSANDMAPLEGGIMSLQGGSIFCEAGLIPFQVIILTGGW